MGFIKCFNVSSKEETEKMDKKLRAGISAHIKDRESLKTQEAEIEERERERNWKETQISQRDLSLPLKNKWHQSIAANQLTRLWGRLLEFTPAFLWHAAITPSKGGKHTAVARWISKNSHNVSINASLTLQKWLMKMFGYIIRQDLLRIWPIEYSSCLWALCTQTNWDAQYCWLVIGISQKKYWLLPNALTSVNIKWWAAASLVK